MAGNAAVESVKATGVSGGRKELESATRMAAGVAAGDIARKEGASQEKVIEAAALAAGAVARAQGAGPKDVARAAATACLQAGGNQADAKKAAVVAATEALISK